MPRAHEQLAADVVDVVEELVRQALLAVERVGPETTRLEFAELVGGLTATLGIALAAIEGDDRMHYFRGWRERRAAEREARRAAAATATAPQSETTAAERWALHATGRAAGFELAPAPAPTTLTTHREDR